jgi:Large polyvalent protein associated domain 29
MRTQQKMDGTPVVYLTCAETAKLVRKALKDAFPGDKFSVRSDTYAGGASIRVGWTDGPTEKAVNEVVGVFAGADFDGMIDLKVYSEHWLHPDGTVTLAKRPGTTGSFVEIIGDPIGPTAQLVHFGADFIPTSRRVSAEWREQILRTFEAKLGREIERSDNLWRVDVPLSVDRLTGELYRMVDHETEAVDTLIHRYTTTRRGGE